MTDQLTLFAAASYDPPAVTLPDQAARDRIHTDLDTSLLVEAGAGAGKTTEMVRRMVALVRSGRAEVHQVAAVTFTRKAAAELRERFQTALEAQLRDATLDAATAERLDRALRDIDRAFLGTIHAFCARLLRERPLEAGLDPAFRETMGAEETRLRRRFWHGWLERLSAEGDADLGVLRHAGLAPHQVAALYDELVEQPDVEYPALAVPRPDPTAVRAAIEALLDRATALERHARRDADGLHRSVRTLAFRRAMGWDDDAAFIDLLGTFTEASFELKKSRWREPEAARAVAEALVALWSPGGAVSELLRDWWAHRYPIALGFARRAAQAYEEERLRAGTLNFHDLLTFAARLLRNSASARRELSDRYRFLLVDEFQDTDPLQAEVLFLLASDEELDLFGGAGVAAWLHLTPRPGALFVVGDPKQSIYRFRRADMTLYQQVRRRFEQWEHGEGANAAVVELTTNFRSRPPIERFVNDVFGRRFGASSTDEQARFAPMRVTSKEKPAVGEGVFRYEHADPHAYVDQIVKADANALASWIQARVASGERQWSDFLVLTPNTTRLSDYAMALEARNAPVQVSGAGVAGPRAVELSELRLLLSALCDPGDSTLVVAVLTGLLFGLDFEQLVQHVEKWSGTRAPFAISGPWDDAVTPVEQALAKLHGFWQLARREPGDVVVSQVVRELGLLPFAAAGELGGSRAGALLFALDTVRAAAAAGDASLGGALAALEAALVDSDAEAPLEPGDRNAVRVMNLHKAKGLEANVVVLAMPVKGGGWPPKRRVVRDTSGRARGYLVVTDAADEHRTLARPRDWDEHAAIEERFQAAEEDRLLYVAATRAAEELVVACAYNMRSPSRWRSFHDWLSLHAVTLDMPHTHPPTRAQLAEDADGMRARLDDVADSLRLHARHTYRAAAVTERKADVRVDIDDAPVSEPMDVQQLGTDWGSAVHDALEALARGVPDDELRLLCRNALVAHERPVGADGVPLELDRLLAVVAGVRASPLWQRAQAAAERLVEVPFAVALSAAEYAAVTGVPAGPDAVPMELVDGRIDLVFREAGGWVIVDYKTDAAGERIPAALMQRYRGQLALYRAAWERITGDAVVETALLFTASAGSAGSGNG